MKTTHCVDCEFEVVVDGDMETWSICSLRSDILAKKRNHPRGICKSYIRKWWKFWRPK